MIPVRRSHDGDGFPDVTPILDVIFILLIFFVIAAAFAMHGVEMALPKTETARTFAGRAMEITLSSKGSLAVDGEAVDARELGFKVRALGESGRQIVLKAAPDATVEAFLVTIGVIRDNGGERLIIATRPAGMHREASAEQSP